MHLKEIVNKNFNVLLKKPNIKSQSYRCNYCPQEYVYHVMRMAKHLVECRSCPQNEKAAAIYALAKFGKRTGQKRKYNEIAFEFKDAADTASTSNIFSSSVNSKSIIESTKQLSLTEFVDRRMPLGEQKYAKVLLATAIFTSGSSSLPENRYWKRFFEYLRPAFKVPSRHDQSQYQSWKGYMSQWKRKLKR